MKIEIELPGDISANIRRVADGFKVPVERVVEIMLADWIGSVDAQMDVVGVPCLPHADAFDKQFADRHPDGWTLESSYDASVTNWSRWLMNRNKTS